MVAEEGYEAMKKGKLIVLAGLTFSQRLMITLTPLMPKRLVLRVIHQLQKVKK